MNSHIKGKKIRLGQLDKACWLDTLSSLLQEIFTSMGVQQATLNVTLNATIVAPPFYEGDVLLKDATQFNHFIEQFSYQVGCLGYRFNEVAFLSARQFCELYIKDSYPEPPTSALSRECYSFRGKGGLGRGGLVEQDFAIGFVLGCPRSGTTLFRTMLNTHELLWAPGELSLAHFSTMSERASKVLPLLRFSIIPELASRLNQSITRFSKTFIQWEQEGLAVSELYQQLHQADPSRLIIDKSPAYSMQLANLEGIGKQFKNARFIHIIRNPHDVIRSFVELQMYKNIRGLFKPGLSPYQMGEIFWTVHNNNIIEFLGTVPNERKCVIRYEDLVIDPEPPLRQVSTLLNIPFDQTMVNPYKSRTGNVAEGASDVHINDFDRVEQQQAQGPFYPTGEECQKLAREYGYS